MLASQNALAFHRPNYYNFTTFEAWFFSNKRQTPNEQTVFRRDVRVANWGGLENRFTCTGNGGRIPPLRFTFSLDERTLIGYIRTQNGYKGVKGGGVIFQN